MSDIKELTDKVIAFRDARDWKQFHNPKDLALSLILEASEVAELFQWKNKEEIERFVREHKDRVAEELWDTMYWVLLLAHDLDINLIDAAHKKMEKNEAKYPVEKAKGSHAKYTEL